MLKAYNLIELIEDTLLEIILKLKANEILSLSLVNKKLAYLIRKNIDKIQVLFLKEVYDTCSFTNIKIKYTILTTNNEKHGLYEKYRLNGQIHSRINFKNGKYHGLYKCWYENEQMHSQVNYQNGKRHGLCEIWDPNGQKWT